MLDLDYFNNLLSSEKFNLMFVSNNGWARYIDLEKSLHNEINPLQELGVIELIASKQLDNEIKVGLFIKTNAVIGGSYLLIVEREFLYVVSFTDVKHLSNIKAISRERIWATQYTEGEIF